MNHPSDTHPAVMLDRRYKGFPIAASPCAIEDIGKKKWNILKGDLSFPIAILRDTALQHNLDWMRAFAKERGVEIAPHGKTSMSPELYRRQMASGAWGISFATVFQLQAGLEAGIDRAIIANQVICDADLDGLSHILNTHDKLKVWFLVDSIAQVERIEAWQQSRNSNTVFDCLLEIGIADMRTGCRTTDEAIAVAGRVRASHVLRLGGIECYEGSVAQCRTEHDRPAVNQLMKRVDDAAIACDRLGYFEGDAILMTAGGSALFDLVTDGLRLSLSKPVIPILRSGCYITHDHGSYMRLMVEIQSRTGKKEGLLPAIEVWAMVQSVPEPGLAILSCGKRDISHDLELPIALSHYSTGMSLPDEIRQDWQLTALNDQHAYLRFPRQGTLPRVGDLIGLGISHPCTTFDKWHWLPVIDENYTVSSAVTTRF